MTAAVYKIESTDGTIYIGSAINAQARWSRHKRQLRQNIHDNQHLQRAYNKHGLEYFVFSILEVVDNKNKLYLQEQKYLNILFCYDVKRYNIQRVTGIGGMRGVSRSEETKRRISDSLRGRKHTAERRVNIAKAKSGMVLSEDHKAKISTGLKGKSKSPKAVENMRLGWLRRKQ